ncbi:MAG: hypothetical protein Q8P76_02595 [bacterium]|nr:hypothetical protein [bacterium]
MTKSRNQFLAVLIVILAFGIAPPVFGDSNDKPSVALLHKSTEFIDWQSLRPGQKGYGLTVFQGDSPEIFEVEFAGVTNLTSKVKMILVRMGHPLEKSQVLSGMSGSPIYFWHRGKWKLAGALGYSVGSFSSDKFLGGVTPIQAMINQEQSLGLNNLDSKIKDPKIQPIQPKMTALAGVAAENSALRTVKPSRPKPGDAVAVLIAYGDFRYGAVGTVTYVKGNKFYAFGHPFVGASKVALPAYKAEIAASFKSPLEGFKIGSNKKNYIGYISFDNVFGIEGEIKDLPSGTMLPVSISVEIDDNGVQKKANFRSFVYKDKLFTQDLIDMAANSLLSRLWDSRNEGTVISHYQISFENRPPMEFFDAYSVGQITQFGPFLMVSDPWLAVNRAADDVGKLLRSDWDFKIKDVQVSVRIRAGDRILVLDALRIIDEKGKPVTKVKMGQTVNLALGLRNSDGTNQFIAYIPLQIPKKMSLKESGRETTTETIEIFVESGSHFVERDEKKLLRHRPDNPEEFIKEFLVHEREPRKIYIQIVFPETTIEEKDPASLIIPKESWQKVPNLNALRSVKSFERKVALKELGSPLTNYVLSIRTSFQLKLIK